MQCNAMRCDAMRCDAMRCGNWERGKKSAARACHISEGRGGFGFQACPARRRALAQARSRAAGKKRALQERLRRRGARPGTFPPPGGTPQVSFPRAPVFSDCPGDSTVVLHIFFSRVESKKRDASLGNPLGRRLCARPGGRAPPRGHGLRPLGGRDVRRDTDPRAAREPVNAVPGHAERRQGIHGATGVQGKECHRVERRGRHSGFCHRGGRWHDGDDRDDASCAGDVPLYAGRIYRKYSKSWTVKGS